MIFMDWVHCDLLDLQVAASLKWDVHVYMHDTLKPDQKPVPDEQHYHS